MLEKEGDLSRFAIRSTYTSLESRCSDQSNASAHLGHIVYSKSVHFLRSSISSK